jgi:hypothetical protein
MKNPKTLEEAREIRYGDSSINPQGSKYKEGYCAYEVWTDIWRPKQCSRKNGKGINGLYCGIHAKKIEMEMNR